MAPKIAFCTTVKGRTNHLQKTLPCNLEHNPEAKFVILNYGSTDHLIDYLKSVQGDAIESGQVVHYHMPDAGTFRMAHAKNASHRCGILEGADILVNLDADNFTGPGFARYIADQMQGRQFLAADVVPGQGLRGCNGRVAVTPNAFINAGGYDEEFDTWGSDDKDFVIRLERLGYVPNAIDHQYLSAINHTDKVRFREYPEARALGMGEDTFDPLIDDTVVNFGKFGCGTVYRNFSTEPIELKPIPTRIFGIGLHKTATNSLHAALQILGYDSVHWPSGSWANAVLRDMIRFGKSRVLERHYAASDLPVAIFYEQLDRAYPNSKFILTVRDDENWLNSVRRHWSYAHNRYRWEWDAWPVSNKIHKLVYGQTTFDADVMLKRYRRHNEGVRDYFAGRPRDLLTMNMDHGAGWKALCGFLGKAAPEGEYPKMYVNGGI